MRARNFGLALLVGVSATACSKGVSARMPSASPVSSLALDIPAPPARTVVPTIVEVPEPPPPPTPPARPREAPAPRPASPAQPSTTAAATPATTEPAPVLQTSANVALIEQRTTQVLGLAQKDLDRLQPASLSANARAQLEQARGFIKMAQDALKIKNYMYAEQLANKAAAVAALLVK
jgi:hypothetical protein